MAPKRGFAAMCLSLELAGKKNPNGYLDGEHDPREIRKTMSAWTRSIPYRYQGIIVFALLTVESLFPNC